jgi:lipoate-protein ligase B
MPLVVHHLGVVPYARALGLQEELVAHKLAGTTDDHLLLLEHEPVYTLGRGADRADLLGADQRRGVPTYRVGRGGGVTFHGPGQLVAYPIVTLRGSWRDVRRYVGALEAVVIAVCGDFGVAAGRHAGQPGVWVGNRKIASIGVGLRRWTTFHGLALNVSTDLRFFAEVVPCRMPGVQMTSLAFELHAPPRLEQVGARLEEHFRVIFGYAAPQLTREAHV